LAKVRNQTLVDISAGYRPTFGIFFLLIRQKNNNRKFAEFFKIWQYLVKIWTLVCCPVFNNLRCRGNSWYSFARVWIKML